MVIFGTVVWLTSPSPIIGPAFESDCLQLRSKSTIGLQLCARLDPGESEARLGSPRQACRCRSGCIRCPRSCRRRCRWGAAPRWMTRHVGKVEPNGSSVPGTPEIDVSPAYTGRPSATGNVRWQAIGVDHADSKRRLAIHGASTNPRSTAKGPTPARRFPQFWRSVTTASATPTWRKR